MVDPDPSRCPLCQEPNACGMAAGKATCWCAEVRLDPRALEAIPEAAKGKACVCSACGKARPKAAAPPEQP